MKIIKRAAILYVAILIAFAVNVYLWGNSISLLFSDLLSYLIPLGILAIGLVLGWFGKMIIQYSRWISSFYIFGLNLSFVLLLAVFGFYHFRAWHRAPAPASAPMGKILEK
jgi:ethanolamine transporter EutH